MGDDILFGCLLASRMGTEPHCSCHLHRGYVAMSSLFVRVRKNGREGTYLCGVCLGAGLRGRGGIEEHVHIDRPV